MTTPVTDPDYKELDFEIGRRLPLAKHLKDSRLSILVFRRRTLRAFIPADHVFHLTLSLIANVDELQPVESTPWRRGLGNGHLKLRAENSARLSR